MKRFFAVMSLGALAVGCSDTPCDIAIDRMTEVIVDECELSPGLQEPTGSLDCTDADAAELERQADCVEASDCYAISGSDPDGHRELSECIAGNGDPSE